MSEQYTLPPLHQFVDTEGIIDCEQPIEIKQKLADKSLLRDLQEQAEWTANNFHFADEGEQKYFGEFSLTPASSLDPLISYGKCCSKECMTLQIDKFAKFTGLFVDKVFLKEPFTDLLLSDGERDDSFWFEFSDRIRAYNALRPLVDAGIVQFTSPINPFCQSCLSSAELEISEASGSLLESLKQNTDVFLEEISGRHVLSFKVPLESTYEDHPLYSHLELSDEQLNTFRQANTRNQHDAVIFEVLEQYYSDTLSFLVGDVLHKVEVARQTGSVFTAGNRIENLFWSNIEDPDRELLDIETWENERSIDLPYLKHLSVKEIVRLRNEAQNALPRLRNMLGINFSSEERLSKESIRENIRNLNEQLLNVEDEFNSVAHKKDKRYNFGVASLLSSFVFYAAATANPIVFGGSIGAVLTSLHLIRANERKCDEKQEKLLAKPAFALLKAKQILHDRSR